MKPRIAPLIAGVTFGTAIAMTVTMSLAARHSDYSWSDPIVDIHSMVRNDFVELPDDSALQQAAIEGMLAALNDPYTVYVPAEDEADFTKVIHGSYVGIGAEIEIIDGYLTIVTPLEDSPALEAGVMAGDTVLEIDGASTHNLTSTQCAEKLMGEPGTPVELKVRRKDGTETKVTVMRRQIIQRTIRGAYRVGDEWSYSLDGERGIGYIRLTQFTDATVPSLKAAIASLEGDLKGLILDLRFNGGGTLNGAIETADLFLARGEIVAVKNRRGESRSATAVEAGTLPEVPMVVMVNGSSASASEIVAGALQDNGRAKVLGTRTFGKGSVQEVRELPDRAGTLKMTTARYYLPSGRNIDRIGHGALWGVDPDPGFHIEVSNREYSEWFDARRQYEVVNDGHAPEGRWSDPQWIEKDLKDRELAGALRAVQGKLDTGAWPTVGDEGGVVAAVTSELQDAVTFRERLEAQIRSVQERIDELSGLPEAKREPLIPDATALMNGRIEIKNEKGEVVAIFSIPDPAILGEALEGAGVKPVPAG